MEKKFGKRFYGVVSRSLVFALVGVCISCFCCSFDAGAADPVILNCVETPEIRDVGEKPSVFNLSNNLARRAGSSVVASGELIYIIGRVTDTHCTPLSNVNVFIWQADAYGRYHSNGKGALGYDENFTGSGKASTDNLGKFGFITVVPGMHLGRTPHIHFLVKHADFPTLQTEMFFEGYSNDTDASFSRIPDGMRRLLTARLLASEGGVKVYEFNITFPPEGSLR